MKKLLFCMLTLSQITHSTAFTTFFNHDSVKTILGFVCVCAGTIGIPKSINHQKDFTSLKVSQEDFTTVVKQTSIEDTSKTLKNHPTKFKTHLVRTISTATLDENFRLKENVKEKPTPKYSHKLIPKVPPLPKQQLINKNALITSALIYTSGLWLLYAGQK